MSTFAAADQALTQAPAEKDQAPLRLLHVIHGLSPADGGPPENLRQLGLVCGSVGVAMEVMTQDDPQASYLGSYPFPVHALGPARSSYGSSQRVLDWLNAHVTEYDGVVVEGLWQYEGWAVHEAATRHNVPYAVFTHGMLDPWFRSRYPLKHLRKTIYWHLRQYAILRDAHRVLFTTPQEQVLAPQSFSPHDWTGVIVPLGISRPEGDPELQKEAFYALCPDLRGQRYLLFLSRIHEKKGCDLLLEAFARVAADAPELHLVMAGPDDRGLKAKLAAFAAERGLGARVHWPGMLQDDVKWGAFHGADAFVLPSHQENFGIAIAEAIACGKPALISNKINIWNYIADDQVGFVAEDTADGAEQLLRNWIGLSPEERAAMLERTGDCFEKRFSPRTAAMHLRDVFAGVRAGRASGAPAV